MGSWEAVVASPEYIAIPGSVWAQRRAEGYDAEDCDTYPARTGCGNCGAPRE